ncbi:hypothetical protein THRCLA_21380 [Thraustotheca clavata]|uniref:Uncharacterized protein n=1 Tax=Thraustotheca clavata TaxID=74557 RepID=A0A1V9ZX53_9STRA|nr:hypothetical protein THRCLA_21380 [Thraustotheca clavata]
MQSNISLPESPPQLKRALTEETMEKNRERAKLYYLNNREKVLAKMKTNYAKKRQRQVEEHCEKYRDFLVNYFHIDPIISLPTQEALPEQETMGNDPLKLSFILN